MDNPLQNQVAEDSLTIPPLLWPVRRRHEKSGTEKIDTCKKERDLWAVVTQPSAPKTGHSTTDCLR